MGDISKQVIVQAPVERLFWFVADPRNAPRYISSITDVQQGAYDAPAEGQVWLADTNFMGKLGRVRLRVSELKPMRLIRFTLLGDPQASLVFNFSPHPNGALTGVTLDLEVPSVQSFVLGFLMSGLITNDLARLRGLFES